MFDIGFWELVLIFVIALVVLGPERLPFAIRNVARFIGNARRMANVVKDELSQELQMQELKEDLEQAKRNNIGLNAAMQEVKSTFDEVEAVSSTAASGPERHTESAPAPLDTGKTGKFEQTRHRDNTVEPSVADSASQQK